MCLAIYLCMIFETEYNVAQYFLCRVHIACVFGMCLCARVWERERDVYMHSQQELNIHSWICSLVYMYLYTCTNIHIFVIVVVAATDLLLFLLFSFMFSYIHTQYSCQIRIHIRGVIRITTQYQICCFLLGLCSRCSCS